ncbi:hypothetical protein [Streptomyces indicus]|uniref:hypothetical protein n=1 Tax=Streptomyces indicus TaxID=417292 RepID=UPI000B80BF92|nr:hypothetical protein [Streptomyces indicus]
MIPLAPLRLSDIYNGAFSTLGRYAKPLSGVMGAALVATLAVAAGALALVYAFARDDWERVASTGDPTWSELRSLLLAVVVGYLVFGLLSVVINAFLTAAAPVVLETAVLGRRTTFGAVWRRAWSRTPSVLGVLALAYLLMLIPSALWLVPSFSTSASAEPADLGTLLVFGLLTLALMPLVAWLYVSISMAPAAAVLESAGPLTALKRSFRLVRGTWWRTCGILLLTVLMLGAVGWTVQIPLLFLMPQPDYAAALDPYTSTGELYADMYGHLVPDLWLWLGVTFAVLAVLQMLFTVFTQLVSALVYIDQRIRREGLADSLARAAGQQ